MLGRVLSGTGQGLLVEVKEPGKGAGGIRVRVILTCVSEFSKHMHDTFRSVLSDLSNILGWVLNARLWYIIFDVGALYRTWVQGQE